MFTTWLAFISLCRRMLTANFVLLYHFEWLLFQFNSGLAIALLCLYWNCPACVCVCVKGDYANISVSLLFCIPFHRSFRIGSFFSLVFVAAFLKHTESYYHFYFAHDSLQVSVLWMLAMILKIRAKCYKITILRSLLTISFYLK